MKRFFLVSAILVMVSAAVALAAQGLRYDVRVALEKAVANEREAVARYEAFAAKADLEGYPGAATLFRANARAEGIHAARFAAILKEHGHEVPAADPPAPAVNGTEDNLRVAASAEAGERDGMYKEAIEKCKLHNAMDIAEIFDTTRDAEVEHGNLCTAAARNLDALKNAKAYYVCGHCGYTTDVRLPLCPSCRKREPPEQIE
jgi:rubrerythrin